MRGQVAEGEAVYRAAIRRFPDNPVCWADLGNTLRIARGPEVALPIYKQAQQAFHKNPVICNALVSVLIDLGRVDDARSALDWALQVISRDDQQNQRVLNRERSRLQQLASGQRPPPKRLTPRPQGTTQPLAPLEQAAGAGLQGLADLGCATLWRQAGELGKARLALSQNAPAQDVRWQAEEAWLIAEEQGWPTARAWLEQRSGQHPGDGVLAALRQAPPGSLHLVLLDPPFDALALFAPALQAAAQALAADGYVYLEAPAAWDEAALAACGLRVHRYLKAGAVHAHLLHRVS